MNHNVPFQIIWVCNPIIIYPQRSLHPSRMLKTCLLFHCYGQIIPSFQLYMYQPSVFARIFLRNCVYGITVVFPCGTSCHKHRWHVVSQSLCATMPPSETYTLSCQKYSFFFFSECFYRFFSQTGCLTTYLCQICSAIMNLLLSKNPLSLSEQLFYF